MFDIWHLLSISSNGEEWCKSKTFKMRLSLVYTHHIFTTADNIQCLQSKAQKPSDPFLRKKFNPKWKSLLTFHLVFCRPVQAFVQHCVVTMVPGRVFMVNKTKVLMSGRSLKLQWTHKVFPLRESGSYIFPRWRSPKFINSYMFFHLFLKNVQLKHG